MKITVNGKPFEGVNVSLPTGERIGYEELVKLAGLTGQPSVTFHKRIDKETVKQGIVSPGGSAPLWDGMDYTVVHTGSA